MARNITAVRFCEGCDDVRLMTWERVDYWPTVSAMAWTCPAYYDGEQDANRHGEIETGAVSDPMGADIQQGDRFTAYRALGSGEFVVKQVVHADGIASVLYSLIGEEHINAYAFNEYEALDTLVRWRRR